MGGAWWRRRRRRRRLPGAVLVAASAAAVLSLAGPGRVEPAGAATPAPGLAVEVIANGIAGGTSMVRRPDGSFLVTEQGGAVRVVRNGTVLPTPFATLPVDATGERGLLGIALHPAYPADPRVYVYRTVPAGARPVHNEVAVLTGAGDQATGGPSTVVDLPNLVATNHNGGALHFGPDGHLYVAVGENAVASRSQQLTNPFGKLLRVTATGAPAPGNPFADGGGPNDDRIFSFGLRNPFTFGFEAGTGRLAINDVGAGTWEEVNVSSIGANHGWPQTEGPTSAPGIVGPAHAYRTHVDGTCAITGGAFYPDTPQVPGIARRWLYADLCAGFVRAVDLGSGALATLATGVAAPVDIDVLPDGSIAVLARGENRILRIVGSQAVFARHTPTTGAADTTFTYGARTDVLLFCDWDGNGTDTVGAFRNGLWLLRNAAGGGGAEVQLGFGDPGDIPVCGDWDGDGDDDVGIYRQGAFYLRTSPGSGVADLVAPYGNAGDQPVTGNWDADADDTIGVRRGDVFHLRDAPGGGVADRVVGYGLPSDRALVGDWNGDGRDTPAVVRQGVWHVRDATGSGPATAVFAYGDAGDRVARANLDGPTGDGPVVIR